MKASRQNPLVLTAVAAALLLAFGPATAGVVRALPLVPSIIFRTPPRGGDVK